VFRAATYFARAGGILPAPESAHAVKAVIDAALLSKEAGKSRVILFNLSGHGLLDLKGYQDYLEGRLVDAESDLR
jgi:tryptophan synthase beta chain